MYVCTNGVRVCELVCAGVCWCAQLKHTDNQVVSAIRYSDWLLKQQLNGGNSAQNANKK